MSLTERTKQLDTTLAQRAQALETSVSQHTGSIRDTLDKQSGSMEHTLARQAAAIERVVSTNSANLQRAVEELANRSSSSGSDALSGQARVLKEVSATLVNQLGGLTKRFEEQGAALINASRTFEVSNTKVDAMMEQRQAGFNKLMENIGSRAAELDRMMNSYSNMLEQSLSQAELQGAQSHGAAGQGLRRKVAGGYPRDRAFAQDAQVHTQKAVSELQANFTLALGPSFQSAYVTVSSKFSDTTRVVRDNDAAGSGRSRSRRKPSFSGTRRFLPETAKQSATAMRRALQDQLSALDALSDLSTRHAYASAVSAPEQRNEPPAASAKPARAAAARCNVFAAALRFRLRPASSRRSRAGCKTSRMQPSRPYQAEPPQPPSRPFQARAAAAACEALPTEPQHDSRPAAAHGLPGKPA